MSTSPAQAHMRRLSEQELRDVARGAAVLGTGGGGDPYLGTLAALRAFEQFGSPKVVEISELPDESLVASPVMVGAPVPLIEKFALGDELDRAYQALDGFLEGRLEGLLPFEIGGVNTIVALALGMRLGLPVVDADIMGRAYPELNLVTLTLYGVKATPFALADEHGNRVVMNTVDNDWTERLGRAIAIEFGAICPGMGYAVTARQAREGAILGTLSRAQAIGAAIRRAESEKRDAIADILEVTGGIVLFRGKIVDVSRRTARGWSLGEAVLEGDEGFGGHSMTIHFQNENLVAMVDGELAATVPDLITILDSDTGQAITTERLRYGNRTVVLGLPCDGKWRTAAGVALGGPRHFGYDFEYVPIEQLAGARLR
jgi:uncharacterized protein